MNNLMFKQNLCQIPSESSGKCAKTEKSAAGIAEKPVSGVRLARKMTGAETRRGLQLWGLRLRYAALRVRIGSELPACGATADLDGLLALGREARALREQIACVSVSCAWSLSSPETGIQGASESALGRLGQGPKAKSIPVGPLPHERSEAGRCTFSSAGGVA